MIAFLLLVIISLLCLMTGLWALIPVIWILYLLIVFGSATLRIAGWFLSEVARYTVIIFEWLRFTVFPFLSSVTSKIIAYAKEHR